MGEARAPDYLQALDTPRVAQAAERALGRSVAIVPVWWGEGLGVTLGVATGALMRLHGVARLGGGGEAPWSLVVKVVRPPSETRYAGAARDPRHWAYWRREPLAYESGLLVDLPGGLAAPRCVLAEEATPEEVWLWLEDVPDEAGPVWPESRYVLAARHLGELGGAYPERRPLPEAPWLGQDFFRRRIALAEQEHNLALFWDDATWRHPLIAGRFPNDLPARLRRLWDRRAALLDALDRTPQTLRHGDAHRQNLSARLGPDGNEVTVAFDWAALSTGNVGADLTDLALGMLLGPRGYPSAAVVETLYTAYVDGLRASDWRGQAGDARLGFTATMALAGATRLHWALTAAQDVRRREALAEGGHTMASALDSWGIAATVFAAMADEAIELALS